MTQQNLNSDIIGKLNDINEFAKRGDSFFADELCNFLCTEFNLKTAVLFRIDEFQLVVIGKSTYASEDIIRNKKHSCSICKNINGNNDALLYRNESCEISISLENNYEYCSAVILPDSFRYFIKMASKTELESFEKELIEKTIRLTTPFISLWLDKLNKKDDRYESIIKLIDTTAKEIKNNANSILGYSNLITNKDNTSANPEHFTIIKRNAQTVLLNINDLSELLKIEIGNIQLEKKKIHLQSFLREIIDLFKKKLSTKKLDISLNFDSKLNSQLIIDDNKLRYIFSNLLFLSANLADDGAVTIFVEPEEKDKIKFVLNPIGKYLSEAIIDKFFQPFGLANKYPGISGLSLPLIKKYVNYMGGNITVSNNNNKGIFFTFTINGEAMSGIESTISKLPKPTDKNRVLVIEDDYATSKLLNNYLNKWGYNPVIVSTEEQAFEIITSEQLLAVILDIELPNTNGLELLKKIHEHPSTKNVPVIVCSIEPEQQKAFMMGAVEYFVKPINYNYLVEVLTSYKLRKDSNILCVDDDIPTLNLVKQAIESAGFNAFAESISANVMELIKGKEIDLAIVDLDMPAPNGFELIKIIKSDKRFAHLPIIIYTGKENYKEDLKSIEGLFEDLLEKRSTNIEDLADTINAMINRYEVPPPQEEVLAKKGGTKILLAEDYKHSQIIVTRLLKKNNFEDIVVVENGEDAVKMARDQVFDLILMDMQMPIMNGFEATESIRQLPEYRTTPIIALTAFAMKVDREKCLEAGATDYIPKPIDSKEFIDKVKYYTNAT